MWYVVEGRNPRDSALPLQLAVCLEDSGGEGAVWLWSRSLLTVHGRLPLTGQAIGLGLLACRAVPTGCSFDGAAPSPSVAVVRV